jgi:hypothetical protein
MEIFQALDWGTWWSFCDRWIYAIGAIALIALLFLLVCRRRCVPMMRGEWGSIFLKKSAIRKIVESMARSIGYHGKIRVRVDLRGETVSIRVVIRPHHWQNLAETSKSLHEELHSALARDIGLEKIGKIDVVVAGFSCSSKGCNHPEGRVCRCDGETCQSDHRCDCQENHESDSEFSENGEN